MGLPGSAVEKNPPANAQDTGDMGLIPGLRRSIGGGNGNPLQYSYQGNSMAKEPGLTVHGVTKSQTQLNTHTPTHSIIYYSKTQVYHIMF